MPIISRRFTDKEWQEIHAKSGAPPEMRRKIEARASTYLMNIPSNLPKPHETKPLLVELSSTADKLLEAYKAVMRNRGARSSLKACLGPRGTLRDANQVLQDIAGAANRSLQVHQPGRRGQPPNVALYWLVSSLAKLWESFSAKPFPGTTRKRPYAREFVVVTCQIIDPGLADATINGVIDNIAAKRRERKEAN